MKKDGIICPFVDKILKLPSNIDNNIACVRESVLSFGNNLPIENLLKLHRYLAINQKIDLVINMTVHWNLFSRSM